jgi:hypothetical protein
MGIFYLLSKISFAVHLCYRKTPFVGKKKYLVVYAFPVVGQYVVFLFNWQFHRKYVADYRTADLPCVGISYRLSQKGTSY